MPLTPKILRASPCIILTNFRHNDPNQISPALFPFNFSFLFFLECGLACYHSSFSLTFNLRGLGLFSFFFPQPEPGLASLKWLCEAHGTPSHFGYFCVRAWVRKLLFPFFGFAWAGLLCTHLDRHAWLYFI